MLRGDRGIFDKPRQENDVALFALGRMHLTRTSASAACSGRPVEAVTNVTRCHQSIMAMP